MYWPYFHVLLRLSCIYAFTCFKSATKKRKHAVYYVLTPMLRVLITIVSVVVVIENIIFVIIR